MDDTAILDKQISWYWSMKGVPRLRSMTTIEYTSSDAICPERFAALNDDFEWLWICTLGADELLRSGKRLSNDPVIAQQICA